MSRQKRKSGKGILSVVMMTWSYARAVSYLGVGQEVESRLRRKLFAMSCCFLDDEIDPSGLWICF